MQLTQWSLVTKRLRSSIIINRNLLSRQLEWRRTVKGKLQINDYRVSNVVVIDLCQDYRLIDQLITITFISQLQRWKNNWLIINRPILWNKKKISPQIWNMFHLLNKYFTLGILHILLYTSKYHYQNIQILFHLLNK